jgi:hypothetical protein
MVCQEGFIYKAGPSGLKFKKWPEEEAGENDAARH